MSAAPTGTNGQATVGPVKPAWRRGSAALNRILGKRSVEASLSVVAFLVLFAIYGIWLGNLFLNVDARLLDIHQSVPILMLALAVLITLVAGLFDLSVAAMATLTTFLTIGLRANQGWPFVWVLIACIGIGLVGGLLNGLLVEVFHVNAFIATLGTGGMFVGLSAAYSGGTQVTPIAGRPPLPNWFSDLGAYSQKCPSWVLIVALALAAIGVFAAMGRLKPRRWSDLGWLVGRLVIIAAVALALVFGLNLPKWLSHTSWLVVLLILTALILWVMIQLTTYGRYLRAIGANRTAAQLAGVRVRREVIKAFMIGGVLAALAGVFLAASQGSAAPNIAGSFLLPAFAAAFLSTVVFSTGNFTVWGTLLGGIFLTWVSIGLIIGGVPATWTDVVNGIVLIVAVALSTAVRRSR